MVPYNYIRAQDTCFAVSVKSQLMGGAQYSSLIVDSIAPGCAEEFI
jgi:hypothetical protein